MKTLLIRLLSWILWSAAMPAIASAAPPSPLPGDAAIRERMRAFVDDAKGAPGVVVAVRDAGGRRMYAYGRTGAGQGAIDPAMCLEIGSISKGFNALLLAEMIGRGEVRADDTIAALMPPGHALPAQTGAITLEDLATHHSGLPRLPFNLDMGLGLLSGDPYVGSTAEDLFAAVAAQNPEKLAERRGRFEYSNLGAAVLGQLLAVRAGKPYPALLRERVLVPLGIKDADFLAGREPHGVVRGHSNGHPVDSWSMGAYMPMGGLVMTAGDLLALGERMLAAQPGFVADALRPRRTLQRADSQVGLGWFHDRIGGHATIWHNGGTSGSRSFFAVVPERGWVIVVLANGVGDADGLGARLIDPSRPPQKPEVSWPHLAFTLLGVIASPLFLLWYALPGRGRVVDRVQALARVAEVAALLALLWRLGDWTTLPFALSWLSLACSALAAVAVAWRVRAAPWLAGGRWRYGRAIYLAALLALLALMLG